MSRLLAIAAVCVPLALAGCGGDDGSDGSGGETTAAEATEQGGSAGAGGEKKAPGEGKGGAGGGQQGGRSGVTITTADSQFGEVLFGEDERAIYYFDKETSDRSECFGACAEAWPPVLTKGEPEASGGARAGLLGTTERRDGSTQVTYDGHPLYYYVDDPPAQVLCHNVAEFGGLWLAVQPSGDPVS